MKKKSIKRTAQVFRDQSDGVIAFAEDCRVKLGEKETSWAYSYAIIALYREFETLMKNALVGAINNDSSTTSATLGIVLPKHLSLEVCEFLVTGSGYFDFRGRDGLIKLLKQYVPKTHYLVQTVKQPVYKTPIDRLVALRNYATHSSQQAKKAALKAVGQDRIGTAGSWLKSGTRLSDLATSLRQLSTELEDLAPY